MKEKKPEIFKNKVNKLKTNIQNYYYYHFNENKDEQTNNIDVKEKINNVFKKPNFVYEADVNIMLKNGDNINKKIIGFKNNYLLLKEGEKINIDDILDIK